MPTPSVHLLAQLRRELAGRLPFARMAEADIDALLHAATEAYHPPGEVMLSPADGPVQALRLLRRGRVSVRQPEGDAVEYEAGDLFPVGATLAARAVRGTYTAVDDVFVLELPAATVQAVAERSPPLADHLHRRVAQLLDTARRAWQDSLRSHTLAEGGLEAPLGSLPRRAPACLPPEAPIGEALRLMHERRIGSVLVTAASGEALGILTRHDVLGRIALPQRPLDTPLAEVMTSPVQTLPASASAHDAALLMSRHGLRHVPVVEAGQVVGIVSERDLFALQRLSLKHLSGALRDAADLATLEGLAADIRRFARNLLAQGLHARTLTELISHLNDLLCVRVVTLTAAQDGIDLTRCCWLAFGSEGRSEQTIATDQDNGLIFVSGDATRDRPAWMAWAARVNAALDRCGYPLCRGGVMAREAACCLTPAEWAERFDHWIDHGAPEDLLRANIHVDLRPVAGATTLAEPLLARLQRSAQVPRFLKQMADNALRAQVPLNWHGGLETETIDGREWLDLKHQGTALFVDAARVLALAHGVAATGTRARLLGAGERMGVPLTERESWAVAFEFLQMLRLQVQLAAQEQAIPGADHTAANRVEPARLNDVDRRMLKESLRIARRLQQRLQLDYGR